MKKIEMLGYIEDMMNEIPKEWTMKAIEDLSERECKILHIQNRQVVDFKANTTAGMKLKKNEIEAIHELFVAICNEYIESLKQEEKENEEMTRKEIERMNNEVITEETIEEIECSEEVETVDCCGTSSSHIGCTWYSVEFTDGESIDVFVKNN